MIIIYCNIVSIGFMIRLQKRQNKVDIIIKEGQKLNHKSITKILKIIFL